MAFSFGAKITVRSESRHSVTGKDSGDDVGLLHNTYFLVHVQSLYDLQFFFSH